MAYLIDTSVLLRFANTSDQHHPVADRAIDRLHAAGETICIAPQIMVEFYNAATRPTTVNGLGFPIAVVDQKLAIFEGAFRVLEENGEIYPAWKRLVSRAGVIGKQVHDARIAAVCEVHHVSHILTFNVRHFTRFRPFLPPFAVVDPATV